jgi:CubicO group peptidase (beta-lactamase class C family)
VLTLVDERRLSLDAPASTWLPELGKVKLADGNPPARPITLRDLLSHTSGIRFPLRSPGDGASSLWRYAVNLVRAPLSFEPGSRYEYNFGITVAGRIAEVVTSGTFQDFMADRILRPLRMNDTTFHPDAALRSRIVRTYTRSEESGGLVPAYNPFITPDPAIRHMPEPSGGLFSTADDMARFYQMVLDGGVWEGRRILSNEMVAEMLRPHTAGGKTLNYGLGWMIHTDRQKPIRSLPVGSFGHGGAFFTNGWVVPKEQLVVVMMMQHVLVPESGQVRDRFYDLVGVALGAP